MSEQTQVPNEMVDPTGLTVTQVARLLGLPEERIRTHVSQGAPTESDGRINLIHYAAWLNAGGNHGD